MIAHAALGCATGAISGGDCVGGAAGGEATALLMLENWTRSTLVQLKTGTLQEADLAADYAAFRSVGINVATLTGGLTALLVGGDVSTGAMTGGNAASNNALPVLLVIVVLALLEATDKALIVNDSISLARALDACNAGDIVACGQAEQIRNQLVFDSAVELSIGAILPGSKIATDLGRWARGVNASNNALTPITNVVYLTGGRRSPILHGHLFGAGKSGKTEFPQGWDADRIMHQVSDVATDPSATRGLGKWDSPYVIGVRDGIEIRVDFYPDLLPSGMSHPNAGKISTAYSTNTPVNVMIKQTGLYEYLDFIDSVSQYLPPSFITQARAVELGQWELPFEATLIELIKLPNDRTHVDLDLIRSLAGEADIIDSGVIDVETWQKFCIWAEIDRSIV